ncbi:acetate--CoA ligase family protein [Streptomyces endophyticus]|uniref:Acetate--CoA ligase family protein n=1 Tax=Streptomyces endophyticus TaxID=714166 RepID=A0ABU6F216_9ACTN|nr:acetate--CoA ligase family protein [Streptomyces endophyticus]MEB8336882.1 acetate--CoA ligase family protein [Streptomyces endophyticus]
MRTRENLRRLMNPRHIAVFGGDAAAGAIRQCRQAGFDGTIWPVHPRRTSIEGIACYPNTAALPDAPDAAFLAVPRETTVSVLAELAARGAGGAVCHASGFAEHGPDGARWQREFVRAAGEMAVIGPNCIGILDYLDGAALWADQHGGRRVDRGVAVITQSGNIGQNLTMQRRSLPLARLVTVGNAAVTGVAELVEAMLDDPRITAIGLHLEGIDDPAGLSRAAVRALRRRVPIVVLKTGRSELGSRANLSHTSSLAGSDVLCDAFFDRVGMARVHQVSTFLETLKFLHVHGALPGGRIASASCSGGEASLLADLAHDREVELPPLPQDTARRVGEVLGERVPVANPLDYHTYVWGDFDAQRDCFREFLTAGFDMHLLVLDFPRADRCSPQAWQTTVDAYMAACRHTGAPACVVSSLPEGLPGAVRSRLLDEGVAPMQGIAECLTAVAAARQVGVAQEAADAVLPLDAVTGSPTGTLQLDEWNGKRDLAEWGVPVPRGALVASAARAAEAARDIGFPVVVKAVSQTLAHKSDVGGVRLGLTDEAQVRDAVADMTDLSDRFLVERMVRGAVAELIVGVHRDPQFGPAITIGAGGVMVELLDDAVTLLLPVQRDEIRAALRRLRIWPLLSGFRGQPPGDVVAVLDAVTAVADYVRGHAGTLRELDINPLLVLPDRGGVVAADVLIRLGTDGEGEGEDDEGEGERDE